MRTIVSVVMTLVFVGCRADPASTTTTARSDEQPPSVSVRILPALTDAQPGYAEMTDPEGQVYYVGTEPIVTESDVVAAECKDDRFGRHTVVIDLSDDGAQRLLDFTKNHIGQHLAILVDGGLMSAPMVNSAVSHTAVITGDFTRERAEEIAAALSGRR